MCEHVSKSIEGLESSCRRWDEVCSSLTFQNNSLHARIEFLKSQVYESNWARSCAEVDRDEALFERRGHEKTDQQMALMGVWLQKRYYEVKNAQPRIQAEGCHTVEEKVRK